jgi:hypothetical protein|tara:strand:- start:490 stop:855 length:366 start_codon:yes stop_codon:yes gene_type:complete
LNGVRVNGGVLDRSGIGTHRGEVAEAVLRFYFGGLRALATSGRADEDQPLVGLGLAVQPALNLAHERIGAYLGESLRHFVRGARRAPPVVVTSLTRIIRSVTEHVLILAIFASIENNPPRA